MTIVTDESYRSLLHLSRFTVDENIINLVSRSPFWICSPVLCPIFSRGSFKIIALEIFQNVYAPFSLIYSEIQVDKEECLDNLMN